MTIPAPNLPLVYLVRIEGTMVNEPCANVIAIHDDVGTRTVDQVASSVASTLSAQLSAADGVAYQNVVSNGRTWTNLHVVRYDADDPAVSDHALVGAEFTGNSAGHALPPQVALCVSLTTGLASRRKRGRLFDYGFTETNNDGTGRADETVRTAVKDFWENFAVATQGEDLSWHVLSRGWVNEGPGDTRPSFAQSSALITNINVRDNLWDTIRSRVPR